MRECPICQKEIDWFWIHPECRDKITKREFMKLFTNDMSFEELQKIRNRIIKS